MQRIFRLIFLSIGMIVFLAAGTVSCRRPDSPDKPVEPVDPSGPVPFKVSLSIIDGERDLEKVIRHPEVTMTLTSEDEAGNYAMTYSVNGGTSKTMKNIWSGTTKTLSSDFRNLTAYGSYTLKGYVYDVSASSLRVPIDTTVLMVYSPAEKTGLSFETLSRSGELTDGTELFEEEFGSLMLSYAPASTYLNVQAFSSNPAVVELVQDKEVNENGLFSVGFKAKSIGKSTITFRTVNGRDTKDYTVPVDVKEDTDGKAVYVDFSVTSDIVFKGLPLTVLLNGHSSNPLRRFNIDYFVDGSLVESDTDVHLTDNMVKTLPGVVATIGRHTVGVKLASTDGRGVPIEKEAVFTAIAPTLTVSGGSYEYVKVGEGDHLSLDVGKVYGVSISDVPEAYLSRFDLSYDSGNYTVTGHNPWSVSPLVYGKGALKLTYTYGSTSMDALSVDVTRNDICDVVAEWLYQTEEIGDDKKVTECRLVMYIDGRYASTVALPVHGELTYHGEMDYPVPSKPQKDQEYINYKETKVTSDKTVNFSATVRASKTLVADLSAQAEELIGMSEWHEYWESNRVPMPHIVYDSDLGMDSGLSGKFFFYDFIVAKVIFEADDIYEGLSFRLRRVNLDSSQVSVHPPFIFIR